MSIPAGTNADDVIAAAQKQRGLQRSEWFENSSRISPSLFSISLEIRRLQEQVEQWRRMV